MIATTACQLMHRVPPEEAIRKRAGEFMNAKVNKDWTKAFTYFDSDYHEMITSRQFERKMSKIEVKAFTIKSITIDPSGEKVTVVVKVDGDMQGFKFKGNPETQTWIEEGSSWYIHVPPKDPKNILDTMKKAAD